MGLARLLLLSGFSGLGLVVSAVLVSVVFHRPKTPKTSGHVTRDDIEETENPPMQYNQEPGLSSPGIELSPVPKQNEPSTLAYQSNCPSEPSSECTTAFESASSFFAFSNTGISTDTLPFSLSDDAEFQPHPTLHPKFLIIIRDESSVLQFDVTMSRALCKIQDRGGSPSNQDKTFLGKHSCVGAISNNHKDRNLSMPFTLSTHLSKLSAWQSMIDFGPRRVQHESSFTNLSFSRSSAVQTTCDVLTGLKATDENELEENREILGDGNGWTVSEPEFEIPMVPFANISALSDIVGGPSKKAEEQLHDDSNSALEENDFTICDCKAGAKVHSLVRHSESEDNMGGSGGRMSNVQPHGKRFEDLDDFGIGAIPVKEFAIAVGNSKPPLTPTALAENAFSTRPQQDYITNTKAKVKSASVIGRPLVQRNGGLRKFFGLRRRNSTEKVSNDVYITEQVGLKRRLSMKLGIHSFQGKEMKIAENPTIGLALGLL